MINSSMRGKQKRQGKRRWRINNKDEELIPNMFSVILNNFPSMNQTTLWGPGSYYKLVTNDKTEAQRGYIAFSPSPSWSVPAGRPRFSDSCPWLVLLTDL